MSQLTERERERRERERERKRREREREREERERERERERVNTGTWLLTESKSNKQLFNIVVSVVSVCCKDLGIIYVFDIKVYVTADPLCFTVHVVVIYMFQSLSIVSPLGTVCLTKVSFWHSLYVTVVSLWHSLHLCIYLWHSLYDCFVCSKVCICRLVQFVRSWYFYDTVSIAVVSLSHSLYECSFPVVHSVLL